MFVYDLKQISQNPEFESNFSLNIIFIIITNIFYIIVIKYYINYFKYFYNQPFLDLYYLLF